MKKRRSELRIIGIAVVAIVVLLVCNLLIFRNFRDHLLGQQENHLLTTAKVVGDSLKDYYDGQINNFDLLFQSEADLERVEEYLQRYPAISSVNVIEPDGNLLWSRGTEYAGLAEWLLEQCADQEAWEQGALLLPPILIEEGHFIELLAKRLLIDERQVWLTAVIETERVYEQIVQPIQIGAYGYSMVKTYDGMILMHGSKSQIGLDAVEGSRRQQYSEYDLNLEDLEVWVAEQRQNPSGSRILESYWWDDEKEPVSTKKVVAYIQEQIGREIWIVNCTLDYGELQQPISDAQWYVLFTSLVIFAGFGGLAGFSLRNMQKSRTMELEMKHLTEMNATWEELHKREEQIRHQDKIQTLGIMTSRISHEFNNFLTPIILYGDILAGDEEISEENRALVREIVSAAEKAKGLTGELSRYGHSGKGSGKNTVLHVVEEIERSLTMLDQTLPVGIRLEQHLESDEGYGLMGSAGMVNQIIVNLCNNAIQAMEKTGGCLTVKGTLLRDGDSVKYAFTVADDGLGMSEEVLKRIFTPFFTTKRQGEGTGLGLSVVQDLIHKASGDINVVSVEGKGTRFDVLLPLFPISGEKSDRPGRHYLENCTVLVLDDDSKTAAAYGKSLHSVCRHCEVFTRPEEALSRMRQDITKWDVVITDYIMEMMNGLEFSGILRSLGYTGKILLISGNLDENVPWYLDNGIVNEALEKPAALADIEEALKLD
ncbi:MAG: ATP-binding protein [Clostridiales bacterium]|nr:ATP-binding protein [Clostridiales bacterium]